MAQAAFNFTVTSPTDGAFLGLSNQLKFTVTGGTLEVTVKVNIQGPGGTTNLQQKFSPNAEGFIDGSIPLNFGTSSPEGAYVITVTASDPTFTAPDVVLNVTLDVTKPKILAFNPSNNAFVKGPIVPITVKLSETNIKEWRVQINGQDIPNNTGETVDSNGRFVVNWDTSGIQTDGQQNITITVKDKAENTTTQSVNVNLDRIKPSITIQFPRSDSKVRPNSLISIVVDVVDGNSTAVDFTGIDVMIQTLGGQLITRASRVSFTAISGTTVRWTGRVDGRRIKLPKQFKIVVTAIDKAGNQAVPQETIVTLG